MVSIPACHAGDLGFSSFEVLKVLQGSEQLQHSITQLHIDDVRYTMSAADVYCLADMRALVELSVDCAALPQNSTEALAAASQALNKRLQSFTLSMHDSQNPPALDVFPGQMTTAKDAALDIPLRIY
jgi:hypothetical protein